LVDDFLKSGFHFVVDFHGSSNDFVDV
jgi:hypothetical protein